MNLIKMFGILMIGLIVGIAMTNLYNSPNQISDQVPEIQHCYDGYWFRNQGEPGFDVGDWVCVNIKNMSYERAVEVCQHEAGHEIFAEKCEKNITKCFDKAENLGGKP